MLIKELNPNYSCKPNPQIPPALKLSKLDYELTIKNQKFETVKLEICN